jgi:hypothetical protein
MLDVPEQSSPKCEAAEKLGLDFPRYFHLCARPWETGVDNELLDLADRLCTVAGMIMEDHNLLAVSRPKNLDDVAAKLQALATAGSDISKLVDAAQVLMRLG